MPTLQIGVRERLRSTGTAALLLSACRADISQSVVPDPSGTADTVASATADDEL